MSDPRSAADDVVAAAIVLAARILPEIYNEHSGQQNAPHRVNGTGRRCVWDQAEVNNLSEESAGATCITAWRVSQPGVKSPIA